VAGRHEGLAQGCTYVLTAALPAIAQDLTINGNGATLHRNTAAGTAAFTILTITAGAVTLNRFGDQVAGDIAGRASLIRCGRCGWAGRRR
jgi:hypothetical protein